MYCEQQYWSSVLKLNAIRLPILQKKRSISLIKYYEDAHVYKRASLPQIDLSASPIDQLSQMEHNLSAWQNIVGSNRTDPIPQNLQNL